MKFQEIGSRDIAEAIFELTINTLWHICKFEKPASLEEISKYIFNKIGLDYNDFVYVNSNELRAGEPINILCNPTKKKRYWMGS